MGKVHLDNDKNEEISKNRNGEEERKIMDNIIIRLQNRIRSDKGSYPYLSGHLSSIARENLPLFYKLQFGLGGSH